MTSLQQVYRHVGGTGIDVLWMSVVGGMRGVGGVCETCMCLAPGYMDGEGCKWREDWVLSIPWEQGVCFVLWRWGVSRGLDQGLEGWGGVMSVCVVIPDSLCRWQVSVCCAWRIPAHQGYLLPTRYLYMAHITNLDLFVCGCRTSICLNITRFYEEQCQPSIGSVWVACQKNLNRAPIAGGERF